jgi:hypothetical protein
MPTNQELTNQSNPQFRQQTNFNQPVGRYNNVPNNFNQKVNGARVENSLQSNPEQNLGKRVEIVRNNPNVANNVLPFARKEQVVPSASQGVVENQIKGSVDEIKVEALLKLPLAGIEAQLNFSRKAS